MVMYRVDIFKVCMMLVVCSGFLTSVMFGVDEGEAAAAEHVVAPGIELAAAQAIPVLEIAPKSAESEPVKRRMSDIPKEKYLETLRRGAKNDARVPDLSGEFAKIHESVVKARWTTAMKGIRPDGVVIQERVLAMSPELVQEIKESIESVEKAAKEEVGKLACYSELMLRMYCDEGWERDNAERQLEQSVEAHAQELLAQKEAHEQRMQQVQKAALLQEIRMTARLHQKQRETQERAREREAGLRRTLDNARDKKNAFRQQLEQEKQVLSDAQLLLAARQNEVEQLKERCEQYEQEREREREERKARAGWLMVGNETE